MEIFEFSKFSEIEGFSIPAFQRRLDVSIVDEIAQHIKDQRDRMKTPYLGAIEVAECGGIIYIIDGQHRYEAYKQDYQNYRKRTKIMILKYHVDDYSEMLNIFRIRNMGVQVPEYILYSESENLRQLMISIEEYISDIPGFVKKEVRRPNVNIAKFMKIITEENVLEGNRIKTLDQFINFLKVKNMIIYNLLNDGSFCRRQRITEPMCKTANSNGNFIGLLREGYWFDL